MGDLEVVAEELGAASHSVNDRGSSRSVAIPRRNGS